MDMIRSHTADHCFFLSPDIFLKILVGVSVLPLFFKGSGSEIEVPEDNKYINNNNINKKHISGPRFFVRSTKSCNGT